MSFNLYLCTHRSRFETFLTIVLFNISEYIYIAAHCGLNNLLSKIKIKYLRVIITIIQYNILNLIIKL